MPCTHLTTTAIYKNKKLQHYKCTYCGKRIKVNPQYQRNKQTKQMKPIDAIGLTLIAVAGFLIGTYTTDSLIPFTALILAITGSFLLPSAQSA